MNFPHTIIHIGAQVSFEISELTVNESVGMFEVMVAREGESDIDVRVQLEIVGSTAAGWCVIDHECCYFCTVPACMLPLGDMIIILLMGICTYSSSVRVCHLWSADHD